MKRALLRIMVLLFVSLAMPTIAVKAEQWPVQNRLFGKKGKASEDISGIACSTGVGFPRYCLVIDDNLQSAQQATVENGRIEAAERVRLIEDAWHGKPLELDGEGVAFADGVFYVIGSHGHPRDTNHKLDPVADRERIEARIAAASQIVPLRLEADRTLTRLPSLTLTRTIATQPELQAAAGRRLEANGLTVEGIAVKGDHMLVGFRGPTLPGGRAAVLDVTLSGLDGGNASSARLFRLPLGQGQGVRDIAPLGQGLLVLAGPTANVAGRYELFAWDGVSDGGVKNLGDVTRATSASELRKPEAVLPLDDGGASLRVLILSDGAKQGDPTVVAVQPP